MNKVNKKAAIIIGIIFITIFFSNIIYAGNRVSDSGYIVNVSAKGRNNIVTNGDKVEITIKSEENFKIKEKKVFVKKDNENIDINLEIEEKEAGKDGYILSYEIPEEIMKDNGEIFKDDNVKLGFSITVVSEVEDEEDEEVIEKVIDAEEKDYLTFYRKLDDSVITITEDGNRNLKRGDVFSININSTHPLDIKDIQLKKLKNEFEYKLESVNEKREWNVSFKLKENYKGFSYFNDIVDIIYEIRLKDEFGEFTLLKQSSNYKYYRPVNIKILEKTVGGVKKNAAKIGDEIVVVFEASRHLETIKPHLQNNIDVTYAIDENGNVIDNTYVAKYTVTGNEEHDKIIKLSLDITDSVGDYSEFEIVNDIKYLKPMNEKSISNFKVNKKFVKDKDKLKITFKSDRPINIDNMELLFNSRNSKRETESIKSSKLEKDKSRCIWIAEFKIPGERFYKDNTQLVYNYNISDAAGNSWSNTGSCAVYFKPIKIDNLKIKSENSSRKFAKIGDTITLSFETTHPVKPNSSFVEMSRNKRIVFNMERKGDIFKYKYSFQIEKEYVNDFDNKEIGIKLVVNDSANNAEKVIAKASNITYYAPIDESFKSLQCDTTNDSVDYVMEKDSITLIYEAGHPVNIEKMVIAGKKVNCTGSNFNKTWKGTIELKGLKLDDESDVEYKFQVTDDAGNTPEIYDNYDCGTVTYLATVKINDLKMLSENKEKNVAKTGDKLTVTFNTIRKIDIKELQIKLSENINVEHKENCTKGDDGNYYYEVFCNVPEDIGYDDKRIGMSITLRDEAGNLVNKDETDISDVILYYRPINVSISNLTFRALNNYGEAAKNGDTLTLSFKSSHPVNVEGNIAGEEVKFISSDGGYNWSGSIITPDNKFSDNSDIDYLMEITDIAGNDKHSVNQKDSPKVTYYAPLSIKELTMESDNESGNVQIAKNNDNVTVRFSTTHPVYISDSIIGGQKVDFVSEDKMNWTAVYKVNDGDTVNMSAIAMSFILNDMAGNSKVTVTQEGRENVIYYAPIQVSGLKISTNNEENGNLYAKDGDAVTVEFSANHQVYISNAAIAGNEAAVSASKISDTEYKCRMDYTIKNGDISDLSNIGFEFILDDEARNNSANINQNSGIVQNTITYYAPFTAETQYSSDYKDGIYVKNGNTITVRCRALHQVKVINATIAGRQAQIQGNDTEAVSMSYKIPENEGAIPEGSILFEYTIKDMAGNELKVNQVSESSVVKNIIYDRTLPVIRVINDSTEGTSFSSDTVKYTLEYTGTNIYEAGMSCIINDVESINDFKKQPIEDGYRLDIELDAEENYVIKPSCTDMAGNKDSGDASIAVTVDKTSPKLKVVNINTGHIFNSEFSLADYLDIDEKNLKDIDCMLTDSEGSHDWDVNSKVKGDGKKTVTLKLTDMAGNTSDTYVYEFFVDVTAPSPVVMDKESGYLLKKGENSKRFAKDISFNISLDKINVGKEPDKFTSIKILDDKENEYMDVIKSGITEENGSYSVNMDRDGEYTLCINAVDSAGNETGVCRYSFIIGNKPWYVSFYENTPVFVTVIVCVSLLTIASAVMVIKKKGK